MVIDTSFRLKHFFRTPYDLSSLKDRGVDSVITLARRLPVTEAESVKVLGEDDLLEQRR